MPIYEFECDSCSARFEALTGSGTSTARCPECGADGASRRISTFAAPTRQMTPGQRRRAEDARGTGRDGARQRFKQGLKRARQGRKR